MYYRLHRSAHHFHAVLLQHPGVVEGDSAVESGLAAHGYENTVRSLPLDDLLHILRCDRQEEHLVCLALARSHVGLHGSDVWVHEHHLHAFFFQRFDGLGPGVVELAGLPNRQPYVDTYIHTYMQYQSLVLINKIHRLHTHTLTHLHQSLVRMHNIYRLHTYTHTYTHTHLHFRVVILS